MYDQPINLLAETIKIMAEHGKTPVDVRWVSSRTSHGWGGKYSVQLGTWDDFAKIADFKYDNGLGGAQISQGAIVAGDDWWLERGEYDGSEWWEFKTMPTRPIEPTPLKSMLERDEDES
jgi:hypothetical protein